MIGRMGPCADRIVGRRSGRRRNEDAVTNELFEADLAVDGDLQLGGLITLAKERDLIDRQALVGLAGSVGRDHGQRVDAADFGGGEPLDELFFLVIIHQEADGAPVHAVNRDLVVDEAM